jgi:hypothetical protein
MPVITRRLIRCECQMSTALMRAGNFIFSNGAQYQVHIGR